MSAKRLQATKHTRLRAHVRRAAVSVPANIAEGAARKETPELLQYLYVANGSFGFVFKRRTRREPQTVLWHGKANQRSHTFECKTVSVSELNTHFELAYRLGFVNNKEMLQAQLDGIQNQLLSVISSLKRRSR